MDTTVAAYDLAPLLQLALLGVVIAVGPLAWVWLRHRGASSQVRLRALTWLTLFLTFDLVLFGAFTRLTDSGLGCPDWPGCYGHASPLGARDHISAAEASLPTGPVTHGKAWVEMVHRYLATAVGVLITVLAIARWWLARRGATTLSPAWGWATLAWVCAQGAFGALTVTMKLYPAIVTAHLLGGLGLLALLAVQAVQLAPAPLVLTPRQRTGITLVAAVVVGQIVLGGWVSTNYAVLACTDFPTCQGRWWPAMDFDAAFSVLRPLGESADGGYLPFAALTAIHVAHRLGAIVALVALFGLAWRLRASGNPGLRRPAAALAVVAAVQLATGLSNVVLGWPLLAAVAHTGGAALLVVLLAMLLARGAPWRTPAPPAGAGHGLRPAS